MDNENKLGKFEQWEAITGETINLRITENPRDLEGTTIQDQYKILEYIGGGGMGWVYKIHDQAMDETQAIKILRPEVKEDDIGESLIKKEARRTQALSHDNIIKTFGVIDWEGILMLRMEYLDGEPLSKLLAREGRLSEERMIPVLNQILDALAYTHAKGLIHRDLKPKNIWVLPDGTLKILDFGLSYRITQSLSRTSLKFSSAGSPYYMSPEQLMGRKDQGPEVDIWAVGVILYQMTTGELPFPGPSFDMFMAQAMQAPLQHPSTVNRDISVNLDGVIRRCLEKDAGNRFASVEDIRNALTSGVGSDDTGDIHVKTSMDCAVRLDNRDMGETRHQEILLEDIPYGAHTVSGSTDTHTGSAGVDVNGPLTHVQLKLEQKLGSLYVKSKVGPCIVTVNGETHDCPVILNDLPVGELVLELTVEDENYPVQVHLEDTGTTTVELDDAKLKELKAEKSRLTAEAAERAEKERVEREQREAEEKAERERREAEERRKKLKDTEQEKLDQLLNLPENTVPLLETKRSQLQNLLSGVQFLTETELQQARNVLSRLEAAIAEAKRTAEEKARAEKERAEKAAREQVEQEQAASRKPGIQAPSLHQSGEVLTLDMPLGGKMEMCWIPAGTFVMGSREGEPGHEDDESPRHEVTLTRGFWMGRFPVTFDQYDDFCDATVRDKQQDEGWGRGDRPVINVSWDDAVAYCEWLSEQTGKHFRLPTEAEWEYACRAGTDTAFCYGNSLSSDMANFDGKYPFNASKGTYRRKTTPVASFKPNAWGIYDMHGNVWEWCQDWYDEDCYKHSPSIDPTGPVDGVDRVLRGGSLDADAQSCRSANRSRLIPSYRSSCLGFRLACDE